MVRIYGSRRDKTAKWIECRKFQICFKLCLMSSKRKNFFPTWFNHKLTKSSRNSWPPAQQSDAFPGGLFYFWGAFAIELSHSCTLGNQYQQFIYTTQVNSAFRAHWLVSSEEISKYYSPLSSRRDKISRQELNFWPFFGILTKPNYFSVSVAAQ